MTWLYRCPKVLVSFCPGFQGEKVFDVKKIRNVLKLTISHTKHKESRSQSQKNNKIM